MQGERLRLARARAGLSLRRLAAGVGGLVSAQAIGKYERGEMAPSPGVLTALAGALSVSADELAEPLDVALDGVEFRKLVGTTKRDRMLVEAEVLRRLEAYLLVEELLGIEGAALDGLWPRPAAVSDLGQAEELAARIRRDWQLGGDPIPNMTELLEERGAKVLILDLPAGVSGLTCLVRRPGNLPPALAVVANRRSTLERRRLTLAHELAHRLLDPEAPGGVNVEAAANRFAGAFLVPADHLRAEVGGERRALGYRELMGLKRRYGVSGAALLVRLRDLGVITPATMTHAFQTFARGWRREEPEPLEGEGCRGEMEAARRFERLCYRSLAEGLIPPAKAAEMLGEPVERLEAGLRGPDREREHGEGVAARRPRAGGG